MTEIITPETTLESEMDNDASWQELIDTIVTVDGIEKPLGECNRQDLDELIFNAQREIARLRWKHGSN
jgi:hypothetical protein